MSLLRLEIEAHNIHVIVGEGIDIEGGARSQAKTPWEGDVLLNFDALVRGQ